MKSKIVQEFSMFLDLHGLNDLESVFSVIQNKYANGIKEESYGMVIGRFQPFHFGHQHIINEIMLDGKIPLVCIGDDLGKNPERNPLTFQERVYLIKQVFPEECLFKRIEDNDDWDIWFSQYEKILEEYEDVTLYYYNKEEDRYERFVHGGKIYENEFYTKIFENAGFKMKEVEFVERSDIKMKANAKTIREDIEQYKHLLDARNYWTLKSWGW